MSFVPINSTRIDKNLVNTLAVLGLSLGYKNYLFVFSKVNIIRFTCLCIWFKSGNSSKHKDVRMDKPVSGGSNFMVSRVSWNILGTFMINL